MSINVPEPRLRPEFWHSRATAERRPDLVKYNQQHTHRRGGWLTTYTGPEDAVLDHVAYVIQHDTCTPQYEHMLTRAISIEDLGAGQIRVTTFKSSYAGD